MTKSKPASDSAAETPSAVNNDDDSSNNLMMVIDDVVDDEDDEDDEDVVDDEDVIDDGDVDDDDDDEPELVMDEGDNNSNNIANNNVNANVSDVDDDVVDDDDDDLDELLDDPVDHHDHDDANDDVENANDIGNVERKDDVDDDVDDGDEEEAPTTPIMMRRRRRRQGYRGGRGGRGGGPGAGGRDKAKDSSDEDDDDDDDDEEEEEEDSEDMDSAECDKKRAEVSEDLGDLEKQFAILREQLYRERITQIEAKLSEVRAGRAAEYLQPLDELQLNMKNRLEVGGILREMRLANIQCKYEAEEVATEQNFASEKDLLIDSLRADLEEKIHILEEDKHNVDFPTSTSTGGIWDLNSGKSRRRKGDPMDPDRRKKPVTVTGPYLVYMLRDEDILDDWTAIKKSLTQRKKLKAV